MNRTAKKCLIASSFLHGTLGLTLLFVSGFANSERLLPAACEITILQALEDEPVSNPNPAATPGKVVGQNSKPMPSVPQPHVAVREPLKLVPMIRDSRPATKPERSDESDLRESFDTVIKTIGGHTSGKVDMNLGRSGSGVPANQERFEDVLKSVYFNSWQQPSDAASDDAVVKVSVTVASDGSVVDAHITKPSGDMAVDRSIERLLKDVKLIAPFPSGSKESQRTYPLSFSLKAKRSLG